MAAFRRAIDLGADGIEFDVQATIDGGLVVVHDLSLERTTNGHGSVFAATLEEVRSLDAGAWFGNEHAGEKVPTLSEVLTLGFPDEAGEVMLFAPDRPVPNGGRLY